VKTTGLFAFFAVPYRPQKKWKGEASEWCASERTIALFAACDLGPVYWTEAVEHANYLRNRSPFTGSRSPSEGYSGRKPSVPDQKFFLLKNFFAPPDLAKAGQEEHGKVLSVCGGCFLQQR
jgi:hypothetical protein